MKKKLQVIALSTIGVLGMMVLSGCVNDKNDDNDVTMQTVTTSKNNTKKSQSFEGTMEDLLATGRPQKCEWSADGAHGVVYLDGKRMRIDIESKDDDIVQKMGTINDGVWVYTWDVMAKHGQKMNIATMEKMTQKAKELKSDNVNDDMKNSSEPEQLFKMKNNYHCTKWSVDDSMFTPPTDVTFEDIADAMNKAREQAQDQCAQLPAEQRTMCEEAVRSMAF